MNKLLLQCLFVINVIPLSAVGNTKNLGAVGSFISKTRRYLLDLSDSFEENGENSKIVFSKHDLSNVGYRPFGLREDAKILNLQLLTLRGGGIDGKAKKLIKAFKLPLNIEKGKSNSAIRLRQMQECPKDPKVAAEGCAELWRICINAEKQDRIGRHKNACSALINVLQVFPFHSLSRFRKSH
jgi:hypothetical protein